MTSEKFIAQKSQQFINTGFQSRTQTNSFFLNPNINNTENSESVPPTEVTEKLLPIVSTLTRGMSSAL